MSRRTKKITLWSVVAMIGLLIALDHAGAFGYRGDDWAHFDRKSVRMTRVLSGDEFQIEDGTTVHLIGVDAPDPPAAHWAEKASEYLTARLINRAFVLKLDGTQTRDAAGALLAYVFITDGDCLNVDMVRDGQAYADRRTKHTMRAAIEAVETDARKKHRGLWKDFHDDQMPAWRLHWLRSLHRA